VIKFLISGLCWMLGLHICRRMAHHLFPIRFAFLAAAVCGLLLAPLGASAAKRFIFTPGTYVGIVSNSPLTSDGTVRVTINRAGNGSLVLTQAGTTQRITLAGTANGHILGVSKHLGLSAQFEAGADNQLAGTIAVGANSISVTLTNASPAVAATTAASQNLAGSYTFIISSPPGAQAFSNAMAADPGTGGILSPVVPYISPSGLQGFGTIQVSPKGIVFFHGALSDGTQFVQTASLNSSGGWTLYATAANGEVLSGEISFVSNVDSDLAGVVKLQLPGTPGSTPPQPEPGFPLRGSHYDPTLKWDIASGADLFISENNGLLLYVDTPAIFDNLLIGSGSVSAALVLDPSTGLVFGGYQSASGLHVMAGVVFQKAQTVLGIEASVTGLSSNTALSQADPASFLSAIEGKANNLQQKLSSILGTIKLGTSGVFSFQAPIAIIKLGPSQAPPVDLHPVFSN